MAISPRPLLFSDSFDRPPIRIDQSEMCAYLVGATVLVTGAGGSIGSELCRQIARLDPSALILLGHGENSIFTVGDGGTILHYDGNTWTTMATPSVVHELFDIWGSSDSDVYAVGSFSGVIFRYDGSTWSTLP